MFDYIKHLFKNIIEFRYLLIGILNTAFSFTFFPVFYFLLHDKKLNYEIILALAYIFTTLFSFLTQRFFVFKSRGNYINELSKFILFQFVIYIINIIFLSVVLPFNIINIIFVQIVFALMIFVMGYFWNKFITFKVRK